MSSLALQTLFLSNNAPLMSQSNQANARGGALRGLLTSVKESKTTYEKLLLGTSYKKARKKCLTIICAIILRSEGHLTVHSPEHPAAAETQGAHYIDVLISFGCYRFPQKNILIFQIGAEQVFMSARQKIRRSSRKVTKLFWMARSIINGSMITEANFVKYIQVLTKKIVFFLNNRRQSGSDSACIARIPSTSCKLSF